MYPQFCGKYLWYRRLTVRKYTKNGSEIIKFLFSFLINLDFSQFYFSVFISLTSWGKVINLWCAQVNQNFCFIFMMPFWQSVYLFSFVMMSLALYSLKTFKYLWLPCFKKHENFWKSSKVKLNVKMSYF